MHTILLPTYLGTPKFDEFVDKFYENVMLSDLVKHFFLLAKKPNSSSRLKSLLALLNTENTSRV